MPPPPSVTLLVIAWRMRATIAEAVRGALAQTLPCEIIISDDSSGDGSLDVVREVLDGYSGPHRVRLRSTAQNVGLCEHLNQLADEATGEILVCASGDDVAYPQRVEKLAAVLASDPAVQLVGSAVDDVDAAGNLIAANVRGLPARIDQRWLLHRGKLASVLGASLAFRRSLVTGLPPLVGRVEDNMLTLRAALLGSCACVPEALLAYRRHDNNLGDWVFDRRTAGYAGFEQRQRRVLAMYREIAADQERCLAAVRELSPERRALGAELARLYRLEADMREAILDRPRRHWIAPLWRGLTQRGLRRKSAERALKLLLPRRWF
ncbi:MAG: glycosyltransferase [Xanthomonadales bacterium]|nr:glycosyltransferase [Xanthomonadales bacterium]